MSDDELHRKVSLLKRLGIIAAVGFSIDLVWLILTPEISQPPAYAVIAAIMVVPFAFYLVLLPIWHWKSRYRGRHSNLWGALIVIETSGWLKIVYLFRHIIPDARGTGRYARDIKTAT